MSNGASPNGPTTSQQALALLAANRANLPAAFRDRAGQKNSALTAGITTGFAILSMRGKNWRVKYQGVERVLMNPDGRSPAWSVDVVIVKSAEAISKVWYEHGYTEGSNAPPDCWSVNGKVPDPASPKLQNPTCAGCKWNAWGSSRTQGGSGKGKDCADSKRLAIVPVQDIPNEMYGGPMLLRVPPASLQNVMTYGIGLDQVGIPVEAVATTISFDTSAEYPKLEFSPLRMLTDEEAEKVKAMVEDPRLNRILETAVDMVQTDGVDTSHTGTPQPGNVVPLQRPQQAPQQPPASMAAFVPPAQPQPAPASQQVAPAGPAPVAVDPNANKRAQMRQLGLTDEQINAALGPEPQLEPEPEPVDPNAEKRAQMKALGLSDEQINAALGVPPTSGGNTTATAEAKRKRRSKAEIEAEKAAQQPAPQPQQAAQPAQGGFGATSPAGDASPAATPAQAAAPAAPQPQGDLAPSALDADFEAQLDSMIGA